MDEKSKIELLMREFKLNSAQFAETVGIKNSILSHILNDRNRPSLDVLKKILVRFHEINPEWLILDTGNMFRPKLNSQEPTLFDSIDFNNKSDNFGVKSPQKEDTNAQVKEKIQEKVVSSSDISVPNTVNVEKIIEKVYVPQIEYRHTNISRIIIYYDDNTFEEFGSKVRTD